MRLLDAIKVGLEVLAAAEAAEKTGAAIAFNWSWRLGKRILRLQGTATVETL